MNTIAEKVGSGYNNAKSWAGSIAEMVAALECDYDRLEELQDERDALVFDAVDAETDGPADALKAWDAENGEELRELIATATVDGDRMKDADEARERIQESPLSVEVRSGWYAPGGESEPEEFCILLSTGGPALRIRGELGQHNEPCRAWLEYQDWGTPWTEYHGEGLEHSSLLTFCQQFYFGD